MDNNKFQELVLQQLQALIEGQKETRNDLTKLETRIEAVETSIKSVETRIEAVETRIEAVETGMRSMETRIEAVEAGMKSVETRIEAVETGMKSMETRIEAVEKNQLRLESRIENQVIEKIRGLYDDREIQNVRFERIESKLDNVEINTGYLVAKVARLETLAKAAE
ncbi:chromosome segregation ATPase [Desulfohalotomaculum tongense]|uniref:hypothetical protein n=1 Tax=Desulforadius tongensis TaxID=1216062 RepID=UPI00195A65AD|nr:hypothetical protein [Desulforadius tongensis]MBM7855054.1 chromosome segregation ATPase [Desulforadius tongensis]